MKINYKKLKEICLMTIPEFEKYGIVTDTGDGIYIHRENSNNKVLAVAHLDTVLNSSNFFVKTGKKNKGDLVFSEQLDDRLGVFTLLELLPQFGLEFDLLLTEGEEIGRSTAMYFQTEKKYNWAFSFDRRGEDVVSYQFEDFQWNKVLQESNFRIGIGSFSDIAFLDDLGIKCVNVGVGYHGEHSKHCYANMNELSRQIERFVNFFQKNKDINFPHVYSPPVYRGTSFGVRGYYGTSDWENDIPYITGIKAVKSPNWGNWGNWKQNTEDKPEIPCDFCDLGIGKNNIEVNVMACDSCLSQLAVCPQCNEYFSDTEIIGGLCRFCIRENFFRYSE